VGSLPGFQRENHRRPGTLQPHSESCLPPCRANRFGAIAAARRASRSASGGRNGAKPRRPSRKRSCASRLRTLPSPQQPLPPPQLPSPERGAGGAPRESRAEPGGVWDSVLAGAGQRSRKALSRAKRAERPNGRGAAPCQGLGSVPAGFGATPGLFLSPGRSRLCALRIRDRVRSG